MQPARPPENTQRNPLTHQQHSREVFWQIAVPLALGVLVILAAATWVVWGGVAHVADTGKLSQAATIWLVAPMLLGGLLFLALLAAMIYLLHRLLGQTPVFFRQVQDIFTIVQWRVRGLSDSAVEPAVRLQSWWASVRVLLRRK